MIRLVLSMQYGILRTGHIKKGAIFLDSPFIIYENEDFN